MNIPLLSKFFGKKNTSLQPLESILVSKLKKCAKESGYPLFENIPIFHRSKKISVPLLLFIPKTGLVLFEYKEWSYEELRHAKASKASHTKKSENSLSFERVGDFIKEKFIDLTTFDDIDIFNFVIMEQLREEEFELLDESFRELLPKDRILFQDSTPEIIQNKLKTLQAKQKIYTIHNTLPFILTQYMILDHTKVYFANQEQRSLIDKELKGVENVGGDRQSGKSTAILQKALLEKLENPQKSIAVITPTHLQKELLGQTLLDIVEHSSIVLDMNDIAIYTPKEISLERKKMPEVADILFVDDAFLMEEQFLTHLKQLQKNRPLVLVNAPWEDVTLPLERSYYGTVEFIQSAEFPTLIKSIYTLLQNDDQSDVLIFTTDQNFEAIKEDIEGFTAKKLSFIDTDRPLREQSQTQLTLCNYDAHIPLHATYTFCIRSCQSDYAAFEYLAKSSKRKSFILYEEECDNIHKLKELQKDTNAKDTQT